MTIHRGRKLSKTEKEYQIKRLMKSLEVQILYKLEDLELEANSTCAFNIQYQLSLIKDRNSGNPCVTNSIIGDTSTLALG